MLTSDIDIFRKLLQKHHELDFAFRDRDGKVFLSDWNCEHPFVDDYLSDVDHSMDRASGVHHYKFFEDESQVIEAIDSFHNAMEGQRVSNENVLGGDGSTPLIFTFCAWLFSVGISEIFYIPPLYYNFYYFGGLFEQRLRPVAPVHPYEEKFELTLPQKKTVLVICDPVWYAGLTMPDWVYDEVKHWQQKTGSIVFVDGSFQYMRWAALEAEPSACLDPELTLRLICPTKIAAIHGFRFSYLLQPKKWRNELRYIYANSHGPGNVHSLRFAKSIMDRLLTRDANRALIGYIEDQYRELIKHNVFAQHIQPNCGYFMFGKLDHERYEWNTIEMDGEFFEQSRYPGYARINLLAPDTRSFLEQLNA